MTIANCPRCCEQVSVPENASHEATVRCPLCQEVYAIIEALAQLPPALIVVADVGETPVPELPSDDDSPWASLSLNDDDADEVALAPMGGASRAAAFDFADGSATAGTKSAAAIRSSSRARKPKGSPIKSVLSIVIGGLMAFPIAQLILWYLPGDLKRDFGAGPIVAQYVPAIVPAKFRGSQAKADPNTEPAFQNSEGAGSDFDFGDTTKFAPSAVDEGQNAGSSPAASRKKKQRASDKLAVSEEVPAAEAMSAGDAPAAGADVFSSPLAVPEFELGGLPLLNEPAPPTAVADKPVATIESPTFELPSLDDISSAVEARKPEVAELALGNTRNAPQVSAALVAKSFTAAEDGNSAWDTDGASSPSASIKREFYQSFSKLGEALTYADRSDENVAAQIAETAKLLHDIGKQPDKLKVISDVANGWIAAGYETRKTNGVCLHGVVKSVEPVGSLFETTVEAGGHPIAVVSKSDPSEYFAEGRQVLVLGTILDDPAKNLGGYEGNRQVVVLDGFHVNVAAE